MKVHPDKNEGCPEYANCKMEESYNIFNCTGDGAYWEWREENKNRSDISFSYWSKYIQHSVPDGAQVLCHVYSHTIISHDGKQEKRS